MNDRTVIALTGADRVAFLQGLVTNDVEKAADGIIYQTSKSSTSSMNMMVPIRTLDIPMPVTAIIGPAGAPTYLR